MAAIAALPLFLSQTLHDLPLLLGSISGQAGSLLGGLLGKSMAGSSEPTAFDKLIGKVTETAMNPGSIAVPDTPTLNTLAKLMLNQNGSGPNGELTQWDKIPKQMQDEYIKTYGTLDGVKKNLPTIFNVMQDPVMAPNGQYTMPGLERAPGYADNKGWKSVSDGLTTTSPYDYGQFYNWGNSNTLNPQQVSQLVMIKDKLAGMDQSNSTVSALTKDIDQYLGGDTSNNFVNSSGAAGHKLYADLQSQTNQDFQALMPQYDQEKGKIDNSYKYVGYSNEQNTSYINYLASKGYDWDSVSNRWINYGSPVSKPKGLNFLLKDKNIGPADNSGQIQSDLDAALAAQQASILLEQQNFDAIMFNQRHRTVTRNITNNTVLGPLIK